MEMQERSLTPVEQDPTSKEQLSRILGILFEIRERLDGHGKQLLTVEEVAELVGRAPYTVRRWVSDGFIHATRVTGTGPRGRLLIDRAEIERVIKAGRGEKIPGHSVGETS